MGKTRRMRQKFHIAAQKEKETQEVNNLQQPNLPDVVPVISFKNDFFAGLDIDISKLNTKLNNDDVKSVKSYKSLKCNMPENTILPKKEKLKLRRELLLSKLDLVNQARKKAIFNKKKKPTPVDTVTATMSFPDSLPPIEILRKYGSDNQPSKVKKAIKKADQRQKEIIDNAKRFEKMLNVESHQKNPFDAVSKHILNWAKCN